MWILSVFPIRSAYFQKIEEDVQKHATSIMEMKSAINSFQTNNMADLQNFHQKLEFHLENLTDETQVILGMNSFNWILLFLAVIGLFLLM